MAVLPVGVFARGHESPVSYDLVALVIISQAHSPGKAVVVVCAALAAIVVGVVFRIAAFNGRGGTGGVCPPAGTGSLASPGAGGLAAAGAGSLAPSGAGGLASPGTGGLPAAGAGGLAPAALNGLLKGSKRLKLDIKQHFVNPYD